MRARVITVSNRATAGVYQDLGGPLIVAALRELDFDVDDPVVIPDGNPVASALQRAVADRFDLVVTTGGTGLTRQDLTPEMTRRVVQREVPGISEAIRAYGVVHGVPNAMLSRGVAGVAGSTLIVNLPGSPGGVKDGLVVLGPVLRHAVEQINGGDH